MNRCVPIVLIAALAAAAATAPCPANEIDFVEDYVLTADKAEAVKQLIPGTETYYYYVCLHHQATGQLDPVDATLKKWLDRNRGRRTARLIEIENRQALLRYRQRPDETLKYLVEKLKVRFDHQRQVARRSKLPTRLDAGLISRGTLTKAALARDVRLGGFETPALQWLIAGELTPRRLRHLLERLDRPDHANLVELIAKDLAAKDSRGFGSLKIHNRLLKVQLDDLAKRKADLLTNSRFVHLYLSRLRPSEDVNRGEDPAEQLAYLDRMWAFVRDLAPSFNSLKAHVLFHRLDFDLTRGVHDRDLFMAYLRLPQSALYVREEYAGSPEHRRYRADVRRDFSKQTLLPRPGDPGRLVRSYLEHFFLKEDTYEPYAKYLKDSYLKRVFAETKLLHGIGDAEKWTAMLSAGDYKALKERVDLDFARTNPRLFGPREPVRLDVHVKNVTQLIVKVYQVSAAKYYRQKLQAVPIGLDLDGLVANERKTYEYKEPPLRRMRRRFDFASLEGPGVYVIELIGSGKRSRALVRKGRLGHVVRTTPAGHEFTVLDEAGAKVGGAELWLAGHLYRADRDGTITVPFTNRPARQKIILARGGAASLASFHHLGEKYALQCGFYVDREAMLRRRQATLLVRPQLQLNGTPVSLSLLKEVALAVTSVDLDGVRTTARERDFKLFEDRESTYEFRTPARLAQITFQLTAKVRSLSKSRDESLSAARTFRLNGIDATPQVEDAHLLRAGGRYALEVCGRNGEALADRPVALRLKHRDFTRPVNVTLKTDARGRIDLGELKDIVRLETSHGPNMSVRHTWHPSPDTHNYPTVLHGRAGGAVRLPYMGGAGKPLRSELSLLEVRAGAYVADRFAALRIAGGMLEVRGLPAGDYSLLLKRPGVAVTLRVTDGKPVAGFLTSPGRRLELRDDRPVQIVAVSADKDNLTIRLAGADKLTRVHVIASRYVPEYALPACLHPFGWLEPTWSRAGKPQTQYVAGRRISDEYRYILDRQYARKFPGNMLKRPSLILNPWSIRKADTGRASGRKGEEIDAARPTAAAPPAARFRGRAKGKAAAANYANLDFLAHGAVVLANLRPDAQGVVTVSRKLLLDKQHVRVLAADAENTACRQITLPEAKIALRDLRLDDADALDPQKHHTQQRKITPIAKGRPFVIRDVTTTRFEIFDSLAKVYRLYATLGGGGDLREFAFILDWANLKDDEKRKLYSKYACHELHLFLSRRDPQFFRRVVLPYLRNKKDKTFLDRWLCGEELGGFLRPWRHGRLNVAERVLLGRRVDGERVRTARHVRDLHDLLPPDVDRFNRLFDTALGVSGLRVTKGDAKGLRPADKVMIEAKEGAVMDLAARLRDEKAGEALSGLARRRRAAAKDEAATAMKALAKARAPAAGVPVRKYDAMRKKRALVRQFYQRLGQVQEWVENNYYHLPVERDTADLVTVNAFWRDYAAHEGAGSFRSAHFAEASRNVHEMLLALAVLDLPPASPKHKVAVKGSSMTLTPGADAVVFHEEINETPAVPKVLPILVSQNYYRLGSRYRHEGAEKVDNFVTDEFLLGTVYGCHVVVTNPTSSRRKLHVLTQVPRGAVPVSKGKYTRTSYVALEPYRTQTFDLFFYFPKAGRFDHYPVHVAQQGKLVGFARPTRLTVVAKLTKVDRTSWDYVSQNASPQDVLAFLRDNNLNRIDLALIAWRVKDKALFRTVVELLARRHVYNDTLWSYGLKHNDPAAIREYLRHRDAFVARCGAWLDSPLLRIEPVVRKTYQHIEYWPLVNARAHRFGPRRKILVARLHQQYHRLMNILKYRNELTDDDRMAVTYYLLVQDRVEEALRLFKPVNAANLATRLQHDYFTAYLDLFSDKPAAARALAEKHRNHPVERWRELFAAVLAQLDEIEGKAPAVVDADDRAQRQTELAAGEKTFEFAVEARKITLSYQNLRSARVNYYLMDTELMFSRQPFVTDRGGQFAYIRPNRTQDLALPADKKPVTVDLPKELHNRNVMVEVVAGGKTRSAAYYSHSLIVQMMENYGQLRVTHQATGKPLAKVYVKVYAQMPGGRSELYKDGYTDLRGRFDYASLNTGQLGGVQKLAVLVLSEAHGSTVREARPPKQ